MLTAICSEQNQTTIVNEKIIINPPPHIMFLLITHSLDLPLTYLTPPWRQHKQQHLPEVSQITNPSLLSRLLVCPGIRVLSVCLPAGLNLSQENQWCAHELKPEDRRSQTNTAVRAQGSFLLTRRRHSSHITPTSALQCFHFHIVFWNYGMLCVNRFCKKHTTDVSLKAHF